MTGAQRKRAPGGVEPIDKIMQILRAPSTLELPSSEALHLSVWVHNETDDDVVCFPTLADLDRGVDVEFEPSLGFLEARSTARFDVRVRRVEGDDAKVLRGGVQATWQLYADGELRDSRPCRVTMEQPRQVRASFLGTHAVRLENIGSRAESLSIRLAPGFGGDVLVPSGPFELAPGETHDVPLYVGGGEPGAERLGLLVVGGPEPILLKTEIRPGFALAAASASKTRGRRLGSASITAWGAAIAAGLALLLTVGGGHLSGTRPTFGTGAPFVMPTKLDVRSPVVSLVNVGSPKVGLTVPDRVYRDAARAAASSSGQPAVVAHPAAHEAPSNRRSALPPPAIVAFSVPETASSGRNIRVRFATKRAWQVEVIAKLGPIVIADRVTSATNGSMVLPVPHTAKWVKILTVRMMAQRDAARSTQSALVAILPPDATTQRLSFR